MTEHIVVKLTPLEARCLAIAANDIIAFGDAMDAVFPHAKDKAAATRAYNKLIVERRRCDS